MDKSQIEKFWQDVKTQRDELKVQMHLAAAELKEEWDEIENKKWPEIEHKLKSFAEDVEDEAEDAKEALSIIGEEIKEAYSRIKKRLKEDDD